ncbi:Ig-like domain-containing protein [Chloroflexota bacterium]
MVIRILLALSLSLAAFGILASPTPVAAAGLVILSRAPSINAINVAKTSNIEVQLNTTINGTTVNEDTFNVDGSISGKVFGSYSGNSTDTITFNPASNFNAGEIVTVTITTGIQGEDGSTLVSPITWQFVVGASQGYANFEDRGQSLGSSSSNDVSLGDMLTATVTSMLS